MPGGAELIVILIIVGIPILLMIGALIDILRSDFGDPLNKVVWALAVIFLPLLGSLLYFLIGRSQKVLKS